MGASDFSESVKRFLADQQVPVERMRSHRNNIQKNFESNSSYTFPIFDTCRKDNGGVISCPHLRVNGTAGEGFASFIPAAGASTRWLTLLSPLADSIQSKNEESISSSIDALLQMGALSFPLPPRLRQVLDAWISGNKTIGADDAASIVRDIESPKALYPAVLEGATFLEMKIREDRSIAGLKHTMFVTPMGWSNEFKAAIRRFEKEHGEKNDHFYGLEEQGPSLATLRFFPNGDVVTGDHGLPSLVPAGHGSLLQLIGKAGLLFSDVHSVWIRNIDNVIGTKKEVVEASEHFLRCHRRILDGVRRLRKFILLGHLKDAFKECDRMMADLGLPATTGATADFAQLSRQLNSIFHFASDEGALCHFQEPKSLFKILQRPVVTMGQVPNTARDVGGTPVFAYVQGLRQKVCIEVPHVNPDDRVNFLENPVKSTHFNPVFSAMEIPDSAALLQWESHPFWLIANKKYRGKDVCYQESILYEMIGSSAYSNVVFVEIPRSLFNPHKSLADAKGRKLGSWI
jgi:hypothetical protein